MVTIKLSTLLDRSRRRRECETTLEARGVAILRKDNAMPKRRAHPPLTPRESPHGDRLYTILKDGRRYDVEIRDDTKTGAGVELQLYQDGVIALIRTYSSLDAALADGLHVRDILQRGWKHL
jgi:hypothetical protein